MSQRSTPVTGRGPHQQKHVYKEVFFAGFPPSSSATNAELVQPFDAQFINDFFQHYGLIERFVYDDVHGVGSVTFVSGEDAERFYLAVHLSVLDCPVLVTAAERERSEGAPPKVVSVMLYLEFAQACPFANPQVLLKEELLSGEMSRYALQASAPPEGLTRTTAEMVVAAWEQPKKSSVTPATAEEEAPRSRVEVIEDAQDTAAGGDTCPPDAEGDGDASPLALFGPVFPGLPVHPAELQARVWQLLRPASFPAKTAPAAPTKVTVLDLWYEYYKTYVLHKTQPQASRIVDPELIFAGKPSLVQQIKAMHDQSDRTDYARRLRRLAEDDVFHGALNYVWLLQKYKYDPVWASFMRDVYTDKVSALVRVHMAEWSSTLKAHQGRKKAAVTAAVAERTQHGRRRRGGDTRKAASAGASSSSAEDVLSPQERMALAFAAQRHELLAIREKTKSTEDASAKVWAETGLFEATENLVENVQYLRLVRLGRVDKATGRILSLEEKIERKAQEGDDTVDEDAYPLTGTSRQTEEFLFAEITRLMDGYVMTGSATELLYLCESPSLFRSGEGHVGYDELHHERYTRRQYWLGVLNTLWVPLILISLVVWGVQRFVGPLELMPKPVANRTAPTRGAPRTAPPPPPGNTLAELRESMRRVEEAAKKRGGHFSFKVDVIGDN